MMFFCSRSQKLEQEIGYSNPHFISLKPNFRFLLSVRALYVTGIALSKTGSSWSAFVVP